MNRHNFYTVTFVDASGNSQISRTFSQIRNARKWAKSVAAYGTNVRIMQGGPGGIEVSNPLPTTVVDVSTEFCGDCEPIRLSNSIRCF